MKPIKKRWLGLSLASTLIAIGAFSTPAMAADYSGNCAFIPNHVTGNATINDTACVIDTGATLIVDGTLTIDADSVDVKSEIQSVGKVTIRTNGGGELKLRKKASSENNDILLQSPQNRIDTKGLEAGNSVQVDAGLNGAEGATWDIKVDGQIIVNKIQSNQNPDLHGNVLLRAAGPISTKTIKTDGDLGTSSVKSGGIQIEAYRSGAAAANGAEFVIGGTGAVNGVNGNIITQSTIGGGTSPSFVNGGVYVTMGGRFNTGNIRVADMTAIKVRATQSRSGFIIFNANGGTIFLPAGNLNTSGDDTNNSGAGLIYLLARTLDTQPGTILSANQSETAAGTAHQIFICVETLKYRGNGTDGLKILNDGNGGGGFFSLVNISPQGYLVPGNLTSNVNQMPWTFSLGSAELAKDGPLTIDGTEGNGQILLRADGNTAAVNVSGYPLAFNGGDVTVRSRGQTLHRINVGFFGTVNGARQGLTINNVGNWVLDANGKAPESGGAAAGGIIQVKADQSSLIALDSPTDPSSGNIVIRANGADTNGDGGIISVDTKSFVLGDTTRAVVNANGAPNGTGNAVTAPLDSAGPFAVTFKSGTSDLIFGGGNKGIRVTATGGGISGNGGTVKILPSSGKVRIRNSIAFDVSGIGSSCGQCDGGQVQVLASKIQGNPAPETGIPQISIKAVGAGSGTGGRIELKSSGDVIAEGHIRVDGGCVSGSGGSVSITGQNVTTTGSISGNAGDGTSCLAIAARSNTAAGNLLPVNQAGGDLTIETSEGWFIGPLTALSFDGRGSGRGGSIEVTNAVAVDAAVLTTDSITARGGTNGGLGGSVTIKNIIKVNSPINVNDVIKVSGGDGLGIPDFDGKIELNSVPCQQFRTGFTSFPKAYWNCVDSTPATGDQITNEIQNQVPVSLKAVLTDKNMQIYLMRTLFDATAYFQVVTQNGSLDDTGGLSVLPYRVAIAFKDVEVNQTTIPNPSLPASIIHEVGHNLDEIWGYPAQSTLFKQTVVLDFFDLSFITNSDGTVVQRPCLDVFQVFTCTFAGANETNEDIFKRKFQSNSQELFAEIFEHRISNKADPELEFALSLFSGLNTYMDNVITNGHP